MRERWSLIVCAVGMDVRDALASMTAFLQRTTRHAHKLTPLP